MNRAQYKAYLQSREWRERRRLVLNRARGLCERCRRAQATQVHHLTYDHVGKEFLRELIAVCRNCHKRYHRLAAT
jgi:5-methylcytosine-specific restriction endonuclease McrA